MAKTVADQFAEILAAAGVELAIRLPYAREGAHPIQ
jgi:hypothetical protein